MKIFLVLLALLGMVGFVVMTPDLWSPPSRRFAERAPEASPPRAPEPPPAPEPAAEEPEPVERIELITGGETMRVGAPPAAFAAAAAPVYRYDDGSGVVRMAEGLDEVPPAYRHRAERVTGGGGAVRRPEAGPLGGAARRSADPAAAPAARGKADAELFSVAGCGPCERARNHLDDLGVAYRLRDVHSDSSARDELERITGMSAVPLLRMGSTYVSGYLPREYDRLAALR